MVATLKIQGFGEVDFALSQFPAQFTNKAVKQAMKESMAQVVLPAAIHDVPVDEGQLRRTLKVRTAKGRGNARLPRGVVGFAVEATKTKTRDAYYALWVFTGAKNRDGTKRPGSRTLRNALYGNTQALKSRIVNKLRKALPVIAEQVRRKSLVKP